MNLMGLEPEMMDAYLKELKSVENLNLKPAIERTLKREIREIFKYTAGGIYLSDAILIARGQAQLENEK